MEDKTQQMPEAEETSQQAQPEAGHDEQPVEAPQGAENNTTPSAQEALKKELDEAKDKYLRLYADFDNFRRRASKEKLEMVKSANEKLLIDILPIVDDFERAKKSLEHEKADIQSAREGFDLIHQKMLKIVAAYGVKLIEDPIGKDLDTELHEAVAQFPAPKEELKGKIIDVVEKGYQLEERVIRFAKVVVGI